MGFRYIKKFMKENRVQGNCIPSLMRSKNILEEKKSFFIRRKKYSFYQIE
jgi:hypothetical protein